MDVTWVLLALLSTVKAQSCNHQLQVVPGQEYNIANPNYPNRYVQGTTCIWTLNTLAGSNVVLSCYLELPLSQNCVRDKLLVSLVGDNLFRNASSFCGNNSFTVHSQANILTLELYSPIGSPGGRFLCSTTAVRSEDSRSTQPPPAADGVCDCGWRQTNRIIGGVETGIHEFPFMTGLFYNRNLICGASIISDRFVLSAAHCVFRLAVNSLLLVVGDHDLSTGSDTSNTAIYNVDAFETHPLYNSLSQKNDIAILRSATQIYFNADIGPICLPIRDTYENFAGQLVTLLGWGQKEFNGPTSKTLQKANVYAISNSQCATEQSEAIISTDLCTYYPDEARDACQFDSGGPVVWFDPRIQRYKLVGIISHGVACGIPAPAINTRVTEFLLWIVDRTGTNFCMK